MIRLTALYFSPWRWPADRRLRYALAFLLLGLLSTILAACGQRIEAGATATAAADAPLVVDLPALYLDYDLAGTAMIGSVRAADLGPAFGVDLSRLNLSPAAIAQLQAANLQHIQLSNTPAGLLVFVNGRRTPSVVWDDATLPITATMVADLAPSVPLLGQVAPLVTQLGGGVVVRFPLAAGATPIAPQLPAATTQLAAAQQTQAEYLAIVGAPPPLTVTVDYQLDGSWVVDGLSGAAWEAAMPVPWTRLNLSPAVVQGAHAAGIATLVLTSNQQGLLMTVNGQPLPPLSWANGELENLVILAAESGLLARVLGDNPHTEHLLATIEGLLPIVAATPVELRVNFPAP